MGLSTYTGHSKASKYRGARKTTSKVAGLFGKSGALAMGDKEVRKITARSMKHIRNAGLSRGTKIKKGTREDKLRSTAISGNRKAAGLPPL